MINNDKYESQKQIAYERHDLATIMSDINSGKYVIPNFQRDYVWTRDKIITFLNSILEDEPFGFIINWEKPNNDESITTRNEIIKELSSENKERSSYYIVDGQQRLTSLFSIFNNKQIISKDSKKGAMHQMKGHLKSIYLNLENGKFEKKSQKELSESKCYLPLSDVIYDWNDTLYRKIKNLFNKEEYNRFSNDEKENIQDIIEVINNKLRKIEVGFINLKNYDIDEVIEIFNKINTQGKKLTIFEIINSKWHSIKVDLEYEFVELLEYAERKNLGEIDNQIPLDALFLVVDNEEFIISGNDKINYNVKENEQHIKNIINKFKKSFKHACDFLKKNNFNYKNLPSKIILKWLTYLFFNLKDDLDNNQKEKILQYIYLISINQVYSKTTHKQLKNDLIFVKKIIEKSNDNVMHMVPNKKDLTKHSLEESDILDLGYGDTSMMANFVSYVLFNEGCDLRNGDNIRDLDGDEINMHHSFPRNASKDGKTFREIYGNLIDSYANLIPIDEVTNKKYISNKRPSIYYEELLKNNKNLDKHLEKSFVNLEFFKKENYREYVNDRAKSIADFINNHYLSWIKSE